MAPEVIQSIDSSWHILEAKTSCSLQSSLSASPESSQLVTHSASPPTQSTSLPAASPSKEASSISNQRPDVVEDSAGTSVHPPISSSQGPLTSVELQLPPTVSCSDAATNMLKALIVSPAEAARASSSPLFLERSPPLFSQAPQSASELTTP